MHEKVKFSLVSVMCIIALISVFVPYSFADGNVTLVQNNFNQQQNSLTANCNLTSSVAVGDTLLITLDAAFIDHTTVTIGDSLHNTWTNYTEILNSASTWAQAWQARNVVHGGGFDNIRINYTDISGRGTYTSTCAEFLGNQNFTQVGGLVVGSASCNTCNLNLSSLWRGHSYNYLTGWSDSSTNTNLGFAYNLNTVPGSPWSTLSGSDTCQTISGSSNCILGFHAQNNIASVESDLFGSGVTVNCSPACSQTPVFMLLFYSSCLGGACAPVTSTITGWLIPAFGNNMPANTSWFIGMIILLLPVGLIDTYFVAVSPNISQQVLVFLNLTGLCVGSIMGVLMNQLPSAFAFIIPVVFVLYLWKGR